MPQDAYCGNCGAPYGSLTGWPRTCPSCGHTSYRNPLPVAIALQPAHDAQGAGLIVITRAIEPHCGGVALPGGYVDLDEEWQGAVVRELREETGIEASATDVRLADALSSPDGHLLLFGLLPARPLAELPPTRPTAETAARGLLRTPRELAFPLHTTAVRRWFMGRYG
ncbi:NUDIX domain-containing protein [Streptomyces sp. NPDC057638]|uniref:NUDIX domain-containing protein n=1 Tax=Streptomyces sp. NPDC057638 TaxID=3346190 RepID=UPI0036AF2483